MRKIKSVFISVFNKEGIDELCKKLHENNIEIISTGGTQKHIEKQSPLNAPSAPLAPCAPVDPEPVEP